MSPPVHEQRERRNLHFTLVLLRFGDAHDVEDLQEDIFKPISRPKDCVEPLRWDCCVSDTPAANAESATHNNASDRCDLLAYRLHE